MPEKPLISIVITSYQRAATLERAARSVLTQTFSDFELILYDDGSTDASRDIANRLAASDPRVCCLAGAHAGVWPATHAALQQAKGTYIGWVDSDDLLVADALESCVSALEKNPHAGAVYTDYLDVDASMKVIGYGKRCAIPYSAEALLTAFMTFHFRLIRRTAYDAVGGIDPTYTAAGDYDLCLRLSERFAFVRVVKALYLYCNHRNNISFGRRLEQIEMTERAIRAAMQRRGMTDTHSLFVDLMAYFTVEPRADAVATVDGVTPKLPV